MSVYTVHQPPARGAGILPDAERLLFVRDGFSFWAFICTPLWMLAYRMWLVFVAYVVITVGLIAGLVALGASPVALVVVGLFIALLVGLESSTLRRISLSLHGWSNIGIVSGHDLEDAERRFFGSWRREDRKASAGVPPPVPPVGSAPPSTERTARPPDVIGLFPEPGGHS
jgi:Protein of unknown function (DUF2628)